MMRTRLSSSLGAKLFAAEVLVIGAGATTLAVVALAVAPGRFHDHVRERFGIVPDDVVDHLDEAFGEAVVFALAVAIAAALVTAIGASLFVAVRVIRPLRDLALTAQRIAQGSYAVRMPVTGSDEVAVLARAFNDMAATLETTERRRTELLADLAHELRTPTATITSYVEAMSDGVLQADDDAWRVLRAEARRIGRLADDLRAVSRAQERRIDVRAVPTDLAALTTERVRSATARFSAEGVALEARIVQRPLPVSADPDRLGEVLDNVLDNALRHTPAGGSVEVTANRRRRRVTVTVADTGDGIDPADLSRVFQRFYRGDPARHRGDAGSGIGLTIARAIVEAHRGTLYAHSEGHGRGSRFVIDLPLDAISRR